MNNITPHPPKGGLTKYQRVINDQVTRKQKIKQSAGSKVPPGGFRGGFWQSWRAATTNPVEALRYE